MGVTLNGENIIDFFSSPCSTFDRAGMNAITPSTHAMSQTTSLLTNYGAVCELCAFASQGIGNR